jgi:5-methylcytosine-specific restriction enzyme A
MGDSRPTARQRGYSWRWEKVRKFYLLAHPLCVMCSQEGRITAASVVDHIKPHKGDQQLFWDPSNWQALCKPHHDSHKQRQERGGIQIIGDDGWPV